MSLEKLNEVIQAIEAGEMSRDDIVGFCLSYIDEHGDIKEAIELLIKNGYMQPSNTSPSNDPFVSIVTKQGAIQLDPLRLMMIERFETNAINELNLSDPSNNRYDLTTDEGVRKYQEDLKYYLDGLTSLSSSYDTSGGQLKQIIEKNYAVIRDANRNKLRSIARPSKALLQELEGFIMVYRYKYIEKPVGAAQHLANAEILADIFFTIRQLLKERADLKPAMKMLEEIPSRHMTTLYSTALDYIEGLIKNSSLVELRRDMPYLRSALTYIAGAIREKDDRKLGLLRARLKSLVDKIDLNTMSVDGDFSAAVTDGPRILSLWSYIDTHEKDKSPAAEAIRKLFQTTPIDIKMLQIFVMAQQFQREILLETMPGMYYLVLRICEFADSLNKLDYDLLHALLENAIVNLGNFHHYSNFITSADRARYRRDLANHLDLINSFKPGHVHQAQINQLNAVISTADRMMHTKVENDHNRATELKALFDLLRKSGVIEVDEKTQRFKVNYSEGTYPALQSVARALVNFNLNLHFVDTLAALPEDRRESADTLPGGYIQIALINQAWERVFDLMHEPQMRERFASECSELGVLPSQITSPSVDLDVLQGESNAYFGQEGILTQAPAPSPVREGEGEQEVQHLQNQGDENGDKMEESSFSFPAQSPSPVLPVRRASMVMMSEGRRTSVRDANVYLHLNHKSAQKIWNLLSSLSEHHLIQVREDGILIRHEDLLKEYPSLFELAKILEKRITNIPLLNEYVHGDENRRSEIEDIALTSPVEVSPMDKACEAIENLFKKDEVLAALISEMNRAKTDTRFTDKNSPRQK